MKVVPITIRTRTITEPELEFIQATVNTHWDKSRTKDMACREILLTLHRNGLLDLPPGKHDGRNLKRNRSVPVVEIDQPSLKKKLSNLPPVNLRLVRNTPIEPLYNSLVQQHHYLGYRQIVGNHLKYMAFIGEQPVACLGWSSAACLSNPGIP